MQVNLQKFLEDHAVTTHELAPQPQGLKHTRPMATWRKRTQFSAPRRTFVLLPHSPFALTHMFSQGSVIMADLVSRMRLLSSSKIGGPAGSNLQTALLLLLPHLGYAELIRGDDDRGIFSFVKGACRSTFSARSNIHHRQATACGEVFFHVKEVDICKMVYSTISNRNTMAVR